MPINLLEKLRVPGRHSCCAREAGYIRLSLPGHSRPFCLQGAWVDVSGYGTHSFHHGGRCYLYALGYDEGRIRELGDWASNTYTAYVIADQAGLAAATTAMTAGLTPQPGRGNINGHPLQL